MVRGSGRSVFFLLAFAVEANASPSPVNHPWLGQAPGTPESLAQGDAVRAMSTGATALMFNPAALVLARTYRMSFDVALSPQTRGQLYQGTIVDSLTQSLAGAVSLSGGFLDPDGINRSHLDARLALAYPLGDRFGMGASVRYFSAYQDGNAPFGAADPVSGGLKDESGERDAFVSAFTFDAGLVIRLADGLNLGVSGQNLTHPGVGLVPTRVGGGISYGEMKKYKIEVDGGADFDTALVTAATLGAGGEFWFFDALAIRAGYGFESAFTSHAVSGGLGYVGEQFGLQASVRHHLVDPGVTTILFGVSLHLESMGLSGDTSPED